jgi:hypothetical protein
VGRPSTIGDEVRHFSRERWWTAPFEMFQTNLREVDAGMDVDAVADKIVAFGADTWLVNAGGIFSFYPTDLPFQTRNPHLADRPSGDLLGDAVEAAHRRGLRLIARMDFSKVSLAIAQEHPEWCFVSPEGEWQVYNGLVSVCPSAGYYQEKLVEVLDEVLDRYDVDGFFFNWFGFNEIDYSGRYWGVSQNPASRSGFAAYSGGRPLPTSPASPDYDLWRRYAAEVIRDLNTRFAAHIRARSPHVGLIRSDITFHEANNEVGRPLWHHATAAAVSAFRAHRPAMPVVVNSVAFLDMPYRLAGEQPEHFAQYLVQAISRGANPSTYIMGTPGDVPYDALDLAGEITRFHDRHASTYADLQPCSTIALVRPDRLVQSLDRSAESVAEFRGVYEALQQTHLAFDVVPQEGLAEMAESGGIDRYRVLVLPDLDGLTPEAAHALDAVVARGGRLLLTGASGFDSDGRAAVQSAPAERIIGTEAGVDVLKSTYAAEAGQHGGRRFHGPILPVHGALHTVAPHPDATVSLEVLGPAPFGPPEKAYGNEPDGRPAALERRCGDGVVVNVPWTIGRSYHDLGLTTIRDVVHGLVLRLHGDVPPAATAELPEQAEITVHSGPAGTVVHVLNLSGARRSSFGPEIPLRGGTVRVATAARAATAVSLAGGTVCPGRWDDGLLTVELPDIGLFDVIVVRDRDPAPPAPRNGVA